jgi:hypothetical protein
MDSFYNFLLVVVFLSIGIYFIYSTYKKPAPFYSTDLKGYLAGISFIAIGIMSLIGRFSLLEVLKKMFNIN